MIRRLLNSVFETVSSAEPLNYYNPFTRKETIPFGWLTDVAPCFPVNANSIKIITDPDTFYKTLLDGCSFAKERITLVSLYLGNGNLEEKLVNSVKDNEYFRSNKLNVRVLLDYTRGSRFEYNSRVMLQPLLLQNNQNCRVSLYHTPELRGLLKKYMPNRWNELLGLQHMKLYIFDDKLIISGANLSNDYFTNRQDRYFVIDDKPLCDFYCGLIDQVQKFSLQMDKNNKVQLHSNWKLSPYEGNKREFVTQAGDIIEQYFVDVMNSQNVHKQEGFDTWIFPLIQIGQLGVEQDAQITDRIFAEAPDGGKLKIATGYFNLTNQYMNTLILRCRAHCDILMAHPKANGFYGAKGPAGGIPYAYSLIAKEFKEKYSKKGQQHRIKLFEYLRSGWTYHAKGLWYYQPGEELPSLTLIGSPNFGHRSVSKDLESQLAIIAENEDLRKSLHEECSNLYELASPAETERRIPAWVYAYVTLFRSYF
nr:CDP-diacylglycerol--glycerol-3-phosphate 3-phosphatidyltransferase, mitochondrial isoform X1 [Leptinotarsa decemlineata]